MDKRAELRTIIEEHFNNSTEYVKTHNYVDISDKIYKKLLKNFDENLNINKFVFYVDTTIFRGCTRGIIFMIDGIYYISLLEKPRYFNYHDMKIIKTIPDKKGRRGTEAELILKNLDNEVLVINYADFHKDNLNILLTKLRETILSWGERNNSKSNGEVEKLKLSKEQLSKCKKIIHTASVSAGAVGAGLAQLPGSDNAIITPIQVTMIVSIGNVFDISVTEGMAKGILSTLVTSTIGRGASQFLVGWIPGIGNVINTATAAGITQAAGWLAVKYFFELDQEQKSKYNLDGMRKGYNMASEEYEEKLKKQAEEFTNKQKNYEKHRKEYEELLKDCETYISELEKKTNKSSNELMAISEIEDVYFKLRAL